MKILRISYKNLSKYEELFENCFKKNSLNQDYLEWLYFKNPLGKVIGFDAIENGVVVAHFACIPTKIDGIMGLLALNNATHPMFRSKGLHEILAKKTFKGLNSKFRFIIAVVNYNSFYNYTKKLGFIEIGRLQLRFGKLIRSNKGLKKWTYEELNWRINSPRTKFKLIQRSDGIYFVNCYPRWIPLIIKSQILFESNSLSINSSFRPSNYGITIDWNKDKRPRIYLPQRFKPSPLILIVKNLGTQKIDLKSISFLDFDAF